MATNYVHNLFNVCSKQHWEPPVKKDCSSSGPEENTIWSCQVFVKGTPYVGSATSKKKAYEEAARKALQDLKDKYPTAVPDDYL